MIFMFTTSSFGTAGAPQELGASAFDPAILGWIRVTSLVSLGTDSRSPASSSGDGVAPPVRAFLQGGESGTWPMVVRYRGTTRGMTGLDVPGPADLRAVVGSGVLVLCGVALATSGPDLLLPMLHAEVAGATTRAVTSQATAAWGGLMGAEETAATAVQEAATVGVDVGCWARSEAPARNTPGLRAVRGAVTLPDMLSARCDWSGLRLRGPRLDGSRSEEVETPASENPPLASELSDVLAVSLPTISAWGVGAHTLGGSCDIVL
mmetsp:Transcript_15239/g.29274  ORF Transcript_15239/g.29274 Transcript_15239/m.29274 type:complete len:264 (+) Transcript_15239:423-1214(+)|eukprot:CAMPEP_0114228626 /NCGR_PEP_ID=MMETSP0058-20121206/2450_1 /TAXON_ID=36894 /ORGANISM="Pyramimonas parkeae, CCMP726" /LENGTH=263 /DNA_ID=CAMNT_0001339599 /DNA_START=412 /DNA_END=1203 /DNA_ORIENTATION=-